MTTYSKIAGLCLALALAGCGPAFDCVQCRDDPEVMEAPPDVAPPMSADELQARALIYDQSFYEMRQDAANQTMAERQEQQAQQFRQQMREQDYRVRLLQNQQDQMQWNADHGRQAGFGPPDPPFQY